MSPAQSSSKSKIGSGRNITNRHEATFKRGSLMFIEGDRSTQMYIIRSGQVRILKQEGESTIELAVLGPGSVLGELSLLDHQPRGATAQVVEDVNATVIDEQLLEATLKKIPSWLNNIINMVVKRLRDTMKRTSDDVVKKSIAGALRVMLLLFKEEGTEENGLVRLELSRIKERLYAIIGLGGLEAENVFLHLILKEMIFIRKDDLGREYVCCPDVEVPAMYMNYLRTKQRGGTVQGEALSEDAVALAATIMAAGEKNGRPVKESIYKVGLTQVEIELERDGKQRHVNLDALDELVEARLIAKEEDVTKSKFGSHKRATLMYNTEALVRMKKLRQWLSLFAEDVNL